MKNNELINMVVENDLKSLGFNPNPKHEGMWTKGIPSTSSFFAITYVPSEDCFFGPELNYEINGKSDCKSLFPTYSQEYGKLQDLNEVKVYYQKAIQLHNSYVAPKKRLIELGSRTTIYHGDEAFECIYRAPTGGFTLMVAYDTIQGWYFSIDESGQHGYTIPSLNSPISEVIKLIEKVKK